MQLKSFNHTAQSCQNLTVFNKNLIQNNLFKNYYLCAEDSLIPWKILETTISTWKKKTLDTI